MVGLGGFESIAVDSLADEKRTLLTTLTNSLDRLTERTREKEEKSNKRKSGDIFFTIAWYIHCILSRTLDLIQGPRPELLPSSIFDPSLASAWSTFDLTHRQTQHRIFIAFAVGKTCPAKYRTFHCSYRRNVQGAGANSGWHSPPPSSCKIRQPDCVISHCDWPIADIVCCLRLLEAELCRLANI